ncbi:putative aldo/keto reductase [Actinoplanes missouriensis 431]|uniref:Putative aldo/keto reductase n=1 Tax=Actinoplanes missouriensis (strain ATCC 14538 / DSM 43046 / CBS 188.64 / JCM 3121 / NBRC 102363 / NCIMB 12654 / NRRL B-3342 / UNCC 431) TaxID=512565 RepID=I0H324_ACTM4|nr:aldo/keto reductase [Actinoplanes missouriensis]BAL87411.1 putative aldo/keto reductase [Actinoplanes missouriensis 431]
MRVDPFENVELGATGVTVTRLGMGLAPIGGLFAPVGDEAAVAAIDEAWRLGVRFFDTAPLYGAGLSERRAGAALRKRERAKYTIATKAGRRIRAGEPGGQPGIWAEPTGDGVEFDFSRAGIRSSYRESLERLGLDRTDVLHLHDPDDHHAEAVSCALPELAELRREGAVGAVSAGMNQSRMLTDLARTGLLDSVLLAGRYSLLDQSGLADLLPECERRGISVIVGGVYNSGVLADPWGRTTYDYRPASSRVVARARAMARLCNRHGVPLRAAALQFPLAHPAVASVLVGMRSAAEASDAVAMARLPIPGALWRDLSDAWLLDPEIPVP